MGGICIYIYIFHIYIYISFSMASMPNDVRKNHSPFVPKLFTVIFLNCRQEIEATCSLIIERLQQAWHRDAGRKPAG